MSELSPVEDAVGALYDHTIFEYENARLATDSAVEGAIVTRYLLRYIPDGATIAEVGVGGGRYSEILARRGCSLRLVDVSHHLLTSVEGRLRAAGLRGQILDIEHGSATHLAHIAPICCDAVLCLGPLYHLPDPDDRAQAVREAARVLKPGGILFAMGINRLAYLRDTFRLDLQRGGERRDFHARFLRDGNLDPDHAPPIGYAHLSTSSEFRALFADQFEEVAYVGVDAFTGVWQGLLPALAENDADAWLDSVEQTGQTPDGLGASDHFLYIGRRTVCPATIARQ